MTDTKAQLIEDILVNQGGEREIARLLLEHGARVDIALRRKTHRTIAEAFGKPLLPGLSGPVGPKATDRNQQRHVATASSLRTVNSKAAASSALV